MRRRLARLGVHGENRANVYLVRGGVLDDRSEGVEGVRRHAPLHEGLFEVPDDIVQRCLGRSVCDLINSPDI